MALNYDVDTLISQIRLSENIPDGAQVFTDDDIIVFMNEELSITVVPIIQSVREEYFTVTKDFSFPQNPGNNNLNNVIKIPNEATGLKLANVFAIDSQGNFYNLPRFTPTQAASYSNVWNTSVGAGWNFGNAGFYVQGNTLELFPYTIAAGNTFRLLYHRRPNELVSLSNAGQILEINFDTGMLTLTNVPSSWTAGTKVDFIQNEPTFDFVEDENATNLIYTSPTTLTNKFINDVPSGNVIFVDLDVTTSLVNGQYVAESGTSPFVQYLPTDVYPLLKETTAIRLLRALNDTEAEQMAIQKFKQMASNVVNGLTSPRVEGKAKKIISTNTVGRYSRMRGGRWGW